MMTGYCGLRQKRQLGPAGVVPALEREASLVARMKHNSEAIIADYAALHPGYAPWIVPDKRIYTETLPASQPSMARLRVRPQ